MANNKIEIGQYCNIGAGCAIFSFAIKATQYFRCNIWLALLCVMLLNQRMNPESKTESRLSGRRWRPHAPLLLMLVWLVCVPLLMIIDAVQGGSSWQPFGEGKNGHHKNFRQARIYYFREVPSFLRLFAILQIQLSIICNVYHVNLHFLPKNTIFDPKKTLFCPFPLSAWIATNLNLGKK